MEECARRVRWLCCLGKGVEKVSDTVVKEVDECVMYWIGKWWQRR